MEGINLVGTAEFVGAQYATIMSSASSYNSKEAILGTLMLLVTFAFLWAGMPLLINFLHYQRKGGIAAISKLSKMRKTEKDLETDHEKTTEEIKKHRIGTAQG